MHYIWLCFVNSITINLSSCPSKCCVFIYLEDSKAFQLFLVIFAYFNDCQGNDCQGSPDHPQRDTSFVPWFLSFSLAKYIGHHEINARHPLCDKFFRYFTQWHWCTDFTQPSSSWIPYATATSWNITLGESCYFILIFFLRQGIAIAGSHDSGMKP